VDVLAGIFAAALLQDLSYTSKTVLVSRGHRSLAVAADTCAMLTSSLYLILAASVTMRSGFSLPTAEAFAAIAIGGACGTIGGMFAVDWLERRLAVMHRRLDVHAIRSAGTVEAPARSKNPSRLLFFTKTLYRHLPGTRAA
jgi:hypothetical protein